MKALRLITIIATLVANASAAPKGIADYFIAIPQQSFTEGSPAELVKNIQNGNNGSILDSKNGYMRHVGDGAQVSLQIALFRFEDKTPLLVVTWGLLEEPDFTHVTLFTEKDGKMIPADRKILPVADSKDPRFERPRYGRTITVRDANQNILSKWTWSGKDFVKE